MHPSLTLVLGLVVAASASAGEVELFDRPDFQGQRFTATSDVRNLDRTGFNDRASSIVIREGTWELCVDADYHGDCIRLRPGEYRELDRKFDRRISSLRLVEDARRGDDDRRGGPPASYAGTVSAMGAVLFEGPDFKGRSFAIDRDTVSNLDRTGFNDRAQSLQVLGGYWIFCSDANFEGDCRTFGPGQYAELPGELNRRISSGRRISDRYPYREQPAWDRRQ